jgi:hypothetical protein
MAGGGGGLNEVRGLGLVWEIGGIQFGKAYLRTSGVRVPSPQQQQQPPAQKSRNLTGASPFPTIRFDSRIIHRLAIPNCGSAACLTALRSPGQIGACLSRVYISMYLPCPWPKRRQSFGCFLQCNAMPWRPSGARKRGKLPRGTATSNNSDNYCCGKGCLGKMIE